MARLIFFLLIIFGILFEPAAFASNPNLPPSFTLWQFSAVNSSTANLAASASFTGASEDVSDLSSIQINFISDQNVTIQSQQSNDGTNWDLVDSYTVTANAADSRSFTALRQFFRLIVTNNGASTTTFLRLQTSYTPAVNVLPRGLTQLGNLRTSIQESLPAGSAIIGSVTQGTSPWLTSRNWTLSSGTDSVNVGNFPATQSVTQGTSPWVISGTVTANAGTNLNTSALALAATQTNGTQQTQISNGTIVGSIKAASTAALAADTSFVVALSPNSPLPTGSNTIGALSANQSVNLNQVGGSSTSLGQKVMASSLPVVIASDQSAVTVTQGNGSGNFGQAWPVFPTVDGVNVAGSAAHPVRIDPTGTTTQPISGTVIANIGSTGGLALDANLTQLTLTQGTTTAGQKGPLIMGAVTTSAPGTYATGQTFPLSLNVQGGLRVDGSGVTQPVSQVTSPWVISGTVSQQSDTAPATQTVTVQDTGSTTTASANSQNFITGTPTTNSTASFFLPSLDAVEVQVTGVWTGTLMTEVSMDSGTTWFSRGVKQSGISYISNSFTSNFEGGLNFSGMTNFRVRATAAMTGTATVRVVASINPASIIVSNPQILRDSTTQSITSTIKAASTAAAATDTALVVAVSPNNTIGVTQSTSPWIDNITQFGGVNISTGTGASGTGIPRVTVSNDSNVLVTQSTNPWTIQGDSASGSPKSGNPIQIGGVFNTTQPTVTTGETVEAQSTARGAQIVATGVDLFIVGNTQGSTTSGQLGPLVQGAVTTSGPTYVTAETSPISLTTTGRVRVEAAGDVASGSADSGNPVKQGHVYNSTLPTPSSGQRVDAQANAFGELSVRSRNKYSNLVGNVSTTVKSGAGVLHNICFNNGANGTTVTIYDNTAASGTKIGTPALLAVNTNVLRCLQYDAEFSTGLTIVTAGSASNDITVTYQ